MFFYFCVAGTVVVVFCFLYKAFFCHLPVKTQRLLLIAGLILATGVLGVDAIENYFLQADGATLPAHNLTLVSHEY